MSHRRNQFTGPMTKSEKINSFNDRFSKDSNGCWIWDSQKDSQGYGKFSYFGEQFSHRVSYIIHKGKIPQGMQVCHTCDNPSCVNPDHLFLGTNKDNIDDKVSKGRQVKGEMCRKSKLEEKQVLEIRKLYKTGIYTLSDLAEHYKVNISNIHSIVKRKYWKHI